MPRLWSLIALLGQVERPQSFSGHLYFPDHYNLELQESDPIRCHHVSVRKSYDIWRQSCTAAFPQLRVLRALAGACESHDCVLMDEPLTMA